MKNRIRTLCMVAIAIAAVALPLASQAATATYNIPASGLLNLSSECSGTSQHWYNGCSSANKPGMKWTDTIPAGSTINTVSITFNDGVDCNGAATFTTSLNGILAGSGTWVGANDCYCTPTLKNRTVALPASAYAIGGTNTFLTESGYSSCLGYSPGGTLPAGQYGVVTVDYSTGGGPVTDPWLVALPGGYAIGSAGRIVGTNLDATMSSRATQASVNTLQTTSTAIQTTVNATQTTVNTIQTTTNATQAIVAANLDAKITSRADATYYTPTRGQLLDNLDVKVTTRATQASVDALDAKIDANWDEDLRIHIETALWGHDRISMWYLPEAQGGHLEMVASIVADVITKNRDAGYNVNAAEEKKALGDEAFAAGDYRTAWDRYRLAYADATH